MLGHDNHGHQLKKSRTTLFLQEFSNIMFVCIFLWSIYGAGSCAEWAAEGRRLVPLMPRLVPQTVFSASATAAANSAAAANAKAPASSGTCTAHQTCWYCYSPWVQQIQQYVWNVLQKWQVLTVFYSDRSILRTLVRSEVGERCLECSMQHHSTPSHTITCYNNTRTLGFIYLQVMKIMKRSGNLII